MIIKTTKTIPESEITDPLVFKQRRKLIKALAAGFIIPSTIESTSAENSEAKTWKKLSRNPLSGNLNSITWSDIPKQYTNYYEFSFNKEDSTELAQKLVTNPWDIEVSGELENPGVYHLEDILQRYQMQEYVYRFRCVEAWSMVIPWVGFPLADLIKNLRPLSTAKFVKFTSVYMPEIMPKQRIDAMLDWPYVEALRMDEALNPLTILAVGMYGEVLPNQNGAPLRLVVPWKYGFKSIKAICKIEFLKRAPLTSWNQFAPTEYGFYANVNPVVPHPRWSQFSERQLGTGFFTPRRRTELFNGYGEQVASMYNDMDLRHFF